jgi:hypothetical protein
MVTRGQTLSVEGHMTSHLKNLALGLGFALLTATPVMAESYVRLPSTTMTTFPSAPLSPHAAFAPDDTLRGSYPDGESAFRWCVSGRSDWKFGVHTLLAASACSPRLATVTTYAAKIKIFEDVWPIWRSSLLLTNQWLSFVINESQKAPWSGSLYEIEPTILWAVPCDNVLYDLLIYLSGLQVSSIIFGLIALTDSFLLPVECR